MPPPRWHRQAVSFIEMDIEWIKDLSVVSVFLPGITPGDTNISSQRVFEIGILIEIDMNKKQIITFAISLTIIIAVFIIWIINGTYVFTQTQILIEKKDPLFGTTYKEWQNKFIWGLDLTLIVSAVSIIASTILFFIFKDKRKRKNEISS